MEIAGGSIKIAPSLLCMDFLHVETQIRILNNRADLYHFDVIDNHFAPTFGLPIEFLTSIQKITTRPIDVHLIVDNVERAVERFVNLGVQAITVHIEGISSCAFRIVKTVKDAGLEIGIAINPVTPLENLFHLLSGIDKVTIMTFDPGMAGQQFVDITLGKIDRLRSVKQKYSYGFDIEVDGSCNEKNFGKVRTAGANQFVVGTSGLFSLDDDLESSWDKMASYMSGPLTQ
jgi:D-allulose-6-phosphate 3-epimerase